MEIVKTYKFRQFIEEMNQYANDKNYSRTYMPDGFFCNVTWEQALKQARYGIKNQAKIEKIISSMSLLEAVKTKGFGMAETGLCVDVGTYLNGEPECWIAEQYEYKPKKQIKILVNVACAGSYNVRQIENRGAGIISLIQMLKKQGYIIKINLYDGTYKNGDRYICFMQVPSNPLDIQSLSYAICSPSLPRRFIFAWEEQQFNNRNPRGGYGSPCKVNEVALSKDIIHFEGLDCEKCDYQDEESTKRYIMNLFDEFLRLNNDKKADE